MPKVLIIDGDSTARTVLLAAITRAGMEGEAVATMESARAILATSTVDVVLLELELPDGHGFDLLRELRGRAHAIVVTTMHQHALVARSRSFGASGYITKPFSPSEIVERVRNSIPMVAA